MAEQTPDIDFADLQTPAEGILVTMFITVRKVARSRDFYSRALGGTEVGQSTGLLHGQLAVKRPEDLPG